MPTVAQHAFAAGDRLSTEELQAHIMAVVAVGVVRMEWILNDGRRQVLRIHFKGDALSGPYRFSGVRPIAVTGGALHLIKERDLYRCHKWRPDRTVWQHAAMSECRDNRVTQAMLLGQFTATEKIATFLSDLAERIGVPRGNAVMVELQMKRDDIADYLGLNTETVSRQLGRMRAAGLLDLPKPGEGTIRNRENLRALSPFTGDSPL